jgi:hypothetical protein
MIQYHESLILISTDVKDVLLFDTEKLHILHSFKGTQFDCEIKLIDIGLGIMCIPEVYSEINE